MTDRTDEKERLTAKIQVLIALLFILITLGILIRVFSPDMADGDTSKAGRTAVPEGSEKPLYHIQKGYFYAG